ncbi:MAG: response regulator transcription factor [Anaerolineaceae bacterium]|nr:response regulator transcription factor [Anaerolineaceae bacterium]
MAKILIVDDEEVARLTLAEILRLEGFQIKTVNSGEAAVEVLNSETFDVMILDLKMNGMSGIDVLNNMMDSRPELSVIILTAYGSFDTAIQAIRYHVHDYLLKPASPDQVLTSIESALEKKRLDAHTIADNRSVYRGRVEELPGGAILAWEKRQISWSSGSLSLTPTEAKLLKILFERKNEMVMHTDLVFMIQGYRLDMEEAAKILRPVVSRLRQKLTSVPEWGDRIKNVRGAGYVLELA